jgi:prepilin-type N-terminal cleavage/methylation domain-containing protein
MSMIEASRQRFIRRERQRNHLGFTLVELAIVLLIVGLILGGLLVPLSQQILSRRISDTEAIMRDIKESLLGYAIANGRLPCPATNGTNGLENRRNDDLAVGPKDPDKEGCRGGAYVGFVPWATLGVPAVDAWGHRFGYRVTNEFTRAHGDATAALDFANCASLSPVAAGTDPNACTLDLTDSGSLAVESRDPATKAKRSLSVQIPAVIISFGKNGFGSMSDLNIAQANPPAVNLDETQNVNPASIIFLTRTITEQQSACSDSAAGQPFCEFDDIVTWIPTSILFSRLLAAGRLP